MKRRFLNIFVKRPEIFTMIIIAVYFIIIGTVNNDFMNFDTIIRILFNGTMLFVLTIGMSSVIITKNIDVSVGSLMGLAATMGGTVLNLTGNMFLAIITTIGVGMLGGFINGIGVSYLGVTAIIMTLGTMAVFRGLLITYTGGKWIQNVPESFTNLAKAEFLGVNLSIWLTIVIVVAFIVFFSMFKVGRYFYAVGNNIEGAKMQGIAVKPIVVSAFTVSGLCAGIAGVVYIAQIGAVPNLAGSGMETQAIAAAVIGGVSLSGGRGNAIGALLGAILLQTVNYSLVYLKVPGYWNDFISGFMLLAIIVLSSVIQNYLRKEKERFLDAQIRTEYFKTKKLLEAGASGSDAK